jgi:hypothetical protein
MAGLSLWKAAGRIIGRDLRDIELDSLGNAPVDVSFCAIETDTMFAGIGKIRVLLPHFLAAELMSTSKIGKLSPEILINSFYGDLNKAFWHSSLTTPHAMSF